MDKLETVQVPTVVIESNQRVLSLGLKSLWKYRELLYFLAWRDLKARYAQTAIGLAWAVLQPLVMMVVYTLVFGRLANMPSDGLPYPLFAYAALVPWSYLAKSLDRSGFSVVAESNLITKVYFPRIVVPLSATFGGLLDLAIAFGLLLVLMAWFGIAPTWRVLSVPVFILLTVGTSLAVSLWLSALYVRYRDVGAAVPLITQLWMFASPVIYPSSLIPDKWRTLYELANPMVGVIDGFRWALLGTHPPDIGMLVGNVATILAVLLCAITYFNRVERTFADVI
jgi:lipopolysaccharide transport system permease protein